MHLYVPLLSFCVRSECVVPLQIQGLMDTFRILDVVDIIVVACILYYVYKLIKDTRAVALLKGLIVLAIINIISRALDLHVVNWLLQQSVTIIMVALPVVFQPELRRALEQLGRGRIFTKAQAVSDVEIDNLLTEVMMSSKVMSREKIGALIVFEREVGLGDFIDTGILVDGKVSRELLNNIFIPNTPLHDGAVIIRGNRVMAAGCLLPLTADRSLSTELGTRHRAAIGLSEQADAVVLVVSEETGKISYAYGGHLYRHLPEEKLRETLKAFLERPKRSFHFWKWGDN